MANIILLLYASRLMKIMPKNSGSITLQLEKKT